MQLFKRLFGGRQRQDSALQIDVLTSRIEQFSQLLEPSLFPKAGMIETIRNADDKGLKLLPNRDVERYLTNGRKPSNISGKIRSGTLLIFEECGRDFRDKVEFSIGISDPETVLFEVPERYQGLGGCLVCEHPDFRFSQVGEKTYRLDVPLSKLHHLRQFPCKEGVFKNDGFFRLPVGEKLKINGNIKEDDLFLSIRPSSFIGLVVKEFGNRRFIYANEFADNLLPAFVRISINPGNYVTHVVSMMKNGANEKMREFVMDWMKEDKRIDKALNE